MKTEIIIELIVAVCSGLAVCVPLVYKLIEYVSAAIREKNWGRLVEMILVNMKTAERLYSDGATKKEYVIGQVIANAKQIDYDIDVDVISRLIDDLCRMADVVNGSSHMD